MRARDSRPHVEISALSPADPGNQADQADELGRRLRRNQVQASLFGKAAEPVKLDRFVLLQQIGQGGMGELYAAYDDRLDREVAIKLVRSERAASPAAHRRLVREARTLARLSHPNVVQVYEVGVTGSQVFMAIELIRGTTLTDWLKSTPALPRRVRMREVLRRFVAAGRGLEAAHQAGLAHRDIKPDNVLIGEDGRVRIADFGLARSVADAPAGTSSLVPTTDEQPPASRLPGSQPGSQPDGHGDQQPASSSAATTGAIPSGAQPAGSPAAASTLTATGAILGTPRYMAPEQWLGQPADSRSDQFSFCVALYEALYQTHPFATSRSLRALGDAVICGALVPTPRGKGVPASVRRALLRGLARDPAGRFPSMGMLLAELERGLERPWRRGLAAAAAMAVLLVVVLGPGWSQHDQADRAAQEARAAARLAAAEARMAELDAAGRPAEADDIFHAFAALPEHQGTAALSRGWLHQAGRMRARGRSDAELDAYATAYALSPEPADQTAALLGLARGFRRSLKWHELGATLATLERHRAAHPGAGEVSHAELRALRVETAVARHDMASAAAELAAARAPSASSASSGHSRQPHEPTRRSEPPWTDPAEVPELITAIHQLGRATMTGAQVDNRALMSPAWLPELDMDRDGRADAVVGLWDEPGLAVLGSSQPSMPVLERLVLPRGTSQQLYALPRVPGQASMLLATHPPWIVLYAASASG